MPICRMHAANHSLLTEPKSPHLELGTSDHKQGTRLLGTGPPHPQKRLPLAALSQHQSGRPWQLKQGRVSQTSPLCKAKFCERVASQVSTSSLPKTRECKAQQPENQDKVWIPIPIIRDGQLTKTLSSQVHVSNQLLPPLNLSKQQVQLNSNKSPCNSVFHCPLLRWRSLGGLSKPTIKTVSDQKSVHPHHSSFIIIIVWARAPHLAANHQRNRSSLKVGD